MNIISNFIKKYKNNIIAIIMSGLFVLLGLLGNLLEVQEDGWFIQSSADGLFGVNNTSLSVLCSHFLYVGILRLLSLIKIRLFWFNLSLILGAFISNMIIIYMIRVRSKSVIWVIKSGIILMVITPVLFFTYLNMTTIATYIIISGAILILFGLEKKSRKLKIFGFCWFTFGGLIRIDCLNFGVLYIGISLLFDIFYDWIRIRYSFRQMLMEHKSKIIVGISIIVLYIGVIGSYKVYMGYTEPGFLEWNTARANVENFALPKYSEYKEEFEAIGISKNDYKMITTGNSTDPEYFSTEKYNKVNEIRLKANNENLKLYGIRHYIMTSNEILSHNPIFWIICILASYILLFAVTRERVRVLVYLGVFFCLCIYFAIVGRFIDRIQIALLFSTLVFMLYYFDAKRFSKVGEYTAWILGALILLCLPFKRTYYCYFETESRSVVETYYDRITRKNTLFSYFRGKGHNSSTYKRRISKELSEDKDNIYIIYLSQKWLTNYPLCVKNPYFTEGMNAASNLVYISYMEQLGVTQNILKNYGVNNLYKDIINSNVRVVVRKSEVKTLVKMLKKYISEHYHEGCTYEVVKYIDDCAIVRFTLDSDKLFHDEISEFYNDYYRKN